MLPTLEQIEYFAGLDPIPSHFKGMGAVPRQPDARDYPPIWHPGYRAIAEAGAAQDKDYSDKVCSLTDQGSTGACVVHSTCSGIQVNEEITSATCFRFNPGAYYTELGGTGSNGIDSRVCLQRCVDVGAPVANTNQRVRVGSYFYIDPNPATFVEAIKTALTAGKSVVIALLLPSTFGGKWVEGNTTQGYHQLDICGTKDRLFFGPNSWGPGFGGGAHPPGFYELSFDYVMQSNFQQRYCYSYFFDAIAISPPPPPPPPINTAAVTGKASGAGVSRLGQGQVYTLGTEIQLQLTSVKFDQTPLPPPPPPGLSVTGYSPNPVKGGDPFYIQGQGFQAGNLTVLWQERLVSANRLSDAQIQATAPAVTTTASGPVTVRVEGATAEGPALTVTAGEAPPPNGDLKVTVTARRYTRGLVGVWAYVQAPGSGKLDIVMAETEEIILPPTVLNPEVGGYVAARCTATMNGADAGPPRQQPTVTGSPATWQLSSVPTAATIVVTATDDQGRRGTGTATV